MDGLVGTVGKIFMVLVGISIIILPLYLQSQEQGNDIQTEMNKISQMMKNANAVTGVQIKEYDADSSISVDYNSATTGLNDVNDIQDNALYEITKTYDSTGNLTAVRIESIIDISK